MKRSFLFLGALCLLVISYSGAWATTFKGSISTDTTPATLIGDTLAWGSDSTLSWTVDDTTDKDGFWNYSYTFDPKASNITNVIIELPNDFFFGDVQSISVSSQIMDGWTPGPIDLATLAFKGPQLTGTMWGLNLVLKNNENYFNWTIVTDRAPMWGNFYGQGNPNKYAYNSEFGTDTSALISDGNAGGWVLVPNSVPEPSTMLLLGFGLMGIAFIGRRKFFK